MLTRYRASMSEEVTKAGDSPMEHVVDDLDARLECEAWILAELRSERAPEELVEELVACDWARDDAEIMVEQGRRATRAERGVVTRDDVMHHVHLKYRL